MDEQPRHLQKPASFDSIETYQSLLSCQTDSKKSLTTLACRKACVMEGTVKEVNK
jgi:hypothetical protein